MIDYFVSFLNLKFSLIPSSLHAIHPFEIILEVTLDQYLSPVPRLTTFRLLNSI